MIAGIIEAFQKAGKNVSDSMALHKSSANKQSVPVNNAPATNVKEDKPAEQAPATGTPAPEEGGDKSGKFLGMLKNIGGGLKGMSAGFMSDEEQKELTKPEDLGMDLIEQFANNVNDYLYTYKKDNVAGEDPTVTHSGPTAQELLKVPGFEDCVYHDEATDTLVVDTERLSLATAGLLADVSKRLLALEETVYPLVGQAMEQEQGQSEQGIEMQDGGNK